MFRLRVISRVSLCALLLCVFAPALLAVEAQWFEVRSPNFRVYTDAGEKRGREVALHFEQMRFVFGKLFQRAKIQTGVPVRVIAFRNTRQFRSVSPLWNGKAKELAGFYQPGEGVAFIALDLSSPKGWSVVFHEYAHLLLNSNMTDTPLWFDEGFAEYYSTADIEKSEWVIGGLPEYAPQHLANNKFIPLLQLFSAKHDSPFYNERDHASMFYAESWLAVEYFWFDPQRHSQLVQYFQLLEQQVPVEEAMRRAFGKAPAQLDQDFATYFRQGQVSVSHFKSPPGLDNMEMKAVPIDALDAQAVISELRVNETDYVQQGTSELEAVLKEKPDQPVALRALGYARLRENDFTRAEPLLGRSVELGSDDARVYFYWAMALQRNSAALDGDSRDKMRKALEKCISLDPQMADAYSLLAFVQNSQGEFELAIKSMKNAIALSPRNERNQLNMASLYLSRGMMEEASALLQPLTHSSDEKVATPARAMFDQLERIRSIRATAAGQGAEAEAVHFSSAEEVADADFEMKTFSGTLTKIECPSPSKLVVTVRAEQQVLVLSADVREISLGGKPLFCDLKNVKVTGYYDGKSSKLVALRVE